MDYFVKVDGGLGRSIASTGAVEQYALNKNKDDRVFVVTGYPFVFDNLDGIERVLKLDHVTLFEDYLFNGEYVEVEPYNSSFHYRENNHLASTWNYLLNKDTGFVRPKIVLSKNELEMGKKWVEEARKKSCKKVLLFQPWGMFAGMKTSINSDEINFDESYRSLELNTVNALVSKFGKDFEVYLVKDNNQSNVNGAISFTENPRLIFSILPFVDGVVCVDSFLQHACKAVETKCPVVVFWGGTNPKQFGYKEFNNIEKDFDRKVEPIRLPHDHSYYVRKNKDCNVFSEEIEDDCVEFVKGDRLGKKVK